MMLTREEVARLRLLLWEIDKGVDKRAFKAYIGNRTRKIRLMLSRAERREKNTLI